MIRLGFCLDLTEPENIEYLTDVYEDYKANLEFAGEKPPRNSRKYRKLDRAVFEYAYRVIEATQHPRKVDTAHGVFVSRDGDKRIWDGSWISRDTHIQLCVRNPACLLGAWLHYPTGLEVKDVHEALQAMKRYKPALPSSSQIISDAKKAFQAMSQLERIDLMVKAGVMTKKQAEKARTQLAGGKG